MSQPLARKESALPRPAPPPRRLLPAAVLVALTLLAFLPAMRGGFFWDDDRFLYSNPLIHAPDGLRRFWLTTEATDYFPLTSTLLWFEWRLWGSNPAGYHVINVLLQAACAVLVWRVLRRLIPQGGTGAWLAGVLFSLHPVAAASAAWITELKNTLSLSLFLAAMLLYLRFDETAEHLVPNRHSSIGTLQPAFRNPNSAICNPQSAFCNRLYLLSLFLFLLALLAKTSVVMLPLVLLLCAWWRRGRISRKDLLRAVPFFALSLALGLVTVWFQRHNAMQREIVRPESVASRMAASGWVAWFYLFKTLLPVGLCAIYPRWAVPGSRLLAFLPLALLLGGIALLWTRRKSWGRTPLFALAYFLIMLLPVLGFVDMSVMQYSLVADHLQYAALIGVLAFAAGTLVQARPERSRKDPGAPAWRGRFAVFVSAACVVVIGTLTWRRASLYADDQRFWLDNVEKYPAVWAAWNNLGMSCQRAGQYGKAVPYFDKAIELNRDYALAWNNLAGALGRLGRHTEALEASNRAVQLKPDWSDAYVNRAAAYLSLGRYALALADCTTAISLNPDAATAYADRGAIYSSMGRSDLAISDFDNVIRLMPGFAAAYAFRAREYYRMKNYDKALADVNTCLRLGGTPDPGLLEALDQTSSRPK